MRSKIEDLVVRQDVVKKLDQKHGSVCPRIQAHVYVTIKEHDCSQIVKGEFCAYVAEEEEALMRLT